MLPAIQVFEDLRGLELWEGNTDLLRMAIGLEGSIHTAKGAQEEFRKWRNPFTYPVR